MGWDGLSSKMFRDVSRIFVMSGRVWVSESVPKLPESKSQRRRRNAERLQQEVGCCEGRTCCEGFDLTPEMFSNRFVQVSQFMCE